MNSFFYSDLGLYGGATFYAQKQGGKKIKLSHPNSIFTEEDPGDGYSILTELDDSPDCLFLRNPQTGKWTKVARENGTEIEIQKGRVSINLPGYDITNPSILEIHEFQNDPGFGEVQVIWEETSAKQKNKKKIDRLVNDFFEKIKVDAKKTKTTIAEYLENYVGEHIVNLVEKNKISKDGQKKSEPAILILKTEEIDAPYSFSPSTTHLNLTQSDLRFIEKDIEKIIEAQRQDPSEDDSRIESLHAVILPAETNRRKDKLLGLVVNIEDSSGHTLYFTERYEFLSPVSKYFR